MDAEPKHLRDRAEWFQKFAECSGSEGDRARRLRLADSLSRRAAELELQHGDASLKSAGDSC